MFLGTLLKEVSVSRFRPSSGSDDDLECLTSRDLVVGRGDVGWTEG